MFILKKYIQVYRFDIDEHFIVYRYSGYKDRSPFKATETNTCKVSIIYCVSNNHYSLITLNARTKEI